VGSARRPVWPFISRLKFVDKDTATLRTFASAATFPQLGIVNAIEACMVGGDVPTAAGIRTVRPGTPTRAVILKARQMGVSTVLEAVAFQVAMCMPNSRGLVVSHDNDSSEHLLSMTRRYWETSWINESNILTAKNMAANRLGWIENDTGIRIATAKNVASGRSHTLRFLHGSEVAFWPDGKTLMNGLLQSVPRAAKTFAFVESTANGIGNYFEQTWNEAVAGDNMYLPLFYAWWQHPGYEAQNIGLGHLVDKPFSNLSEEERALSRGFRRLGLDDTQVRAKLIWRREILGTECLGDLDKFHQEYPSTPEEAFISTGRNVFPKEHLVAAYEPEDGERGELRLRRGHPEFFPDRAGPLRIFRRPVDHKSYAVGGDAAKQAKGDRAVCQVLDRSTWEQVATLANDVDPVTFAEQNMMLGRYYNDALLIPETNMSGGVVAEICRSQYDNVYIHQSEAKVRGQMASQYGFNTTVQTKPEVIGHLKRAFYDASRNQCTIVIHDRTTFNELKNYILTDTGEYKNAGGEAEGADHDDHVMALGLALIGTIQYADELDTDTPHATSDEYQIRRVAATLGAEPSTRATTRTRTRGDAGYNPDLPDDEQEEIIEVAPRSYRRREWSESDAYVDYGRDNIWGDDDLDDDTYN